MFLLYHDFVMDGNYSFTHIHPGDFAGIRANFESSYVPMK